MSAVEFPVIDPATTALVYGDYQVGILANYPSAPEVVAKAVKVREVARAAGITVAYIRVGFTDADYAAIPAENKTFSSLAASRRLQADSPDSQIVPELTPASDEIVVRKVRFGGFSTTDLYEQLKARGIKTIIISGVATGGVVVSTVRDASDKDMRIFVIKDLCLDADPELHEALTEKLFPRSAWVLSSSELLEQISK
jgi:nicotinamidase-related amidase